MWRGTVGHLPAPDEYDAWWFGGLSSAAALPFVSGSLLMSVFFAPLAEETIYRAILIEGPLARCRPAIVVMASAVVFAFLHAVPYGQGGFPPAPFIGGALTAVAYLWRRSLIAPLAIHAAGNLWLEALGVTHVVAWKAWPGLFG